MKEYLKILPEELKEIIRLASEVSRQTGMPAYLVGGFLRDLLLGVKNFDLDIAVEGDGIIFARNLSEKLKSQIRTHERFKTATLALNSFLKIDIATTRKETYPFCACLPEVSCGLLSEDLLRRDFTINAMAVNISGDEFRLIDPFRGKEDLTSGRIRVLHDLSFTDDPTRILRAIRFEQRFNFTIEPKTLSLLNDASKKGLLNKLSPHRVRDELILMLKEKNPSRQIKRLDRLCSLSFISKDLKTGRSAYDLFKSAGKEIKWFQKNFPDYRRLDEWLIYFTALLKDLEKKEIKKVIYRFGLRKGEQARILSYFGSATKLIRSLSKKNLLPARIFNCFEPLSYETIVLLRASSKNKSFREYIANFLEIYNGMKLYVSGKDLAGLGVKPGPKYQKIFAKVLEAKLNGKVNSQRDELALIGKLIKKIK